MKLYVKRLCFDSQAFRHAIRHIDVLAAGLRPMLRMLASIVSHK